MVQRQKLDFPVCLLQTLTEARKRILPLSVDEHWQKHAISSSCCLATQRDKRSQMQSSQPAYAKSSQSQISKWAVPFWRRGWRPAEPTEDSRTGKWIPPSLFFVQRLLSFISGTNTLSWCLSLPAVWNGFPTFPFARPHFNKTLWSDLHLRQFCPGLHVNNFFLEESELNAGCLWTTLTHLFHIAKLHQNF